MNGFIDVLTAGDNGDHDNQRFHQKLCHNLTSGSVYYYHR